MEERYLKDIHRFGQVAYAHGRTRNARWKDFIIQKTPTDLWVYQEIIHAVRPTVILECGSARGGSARFFADMMEMMGIRPNVVACTVDVQDQTPLPAALADSRIQFHLGSSLDPRIFARMKAATEGHDVVLVSLDSDHSYGHVLQEAKLYADLVTVGSYLVIEDTIFDVGPAVRGHVQGPGKAAREFVQKDSRFRVDPERECYLWTQFPEGWLQRIR